MGIFGTGWILVWQVLLLLAGVMFVILPFWVQADETLHLPPTEPSLGTFGIVMMAAFYFFAGALIGTGLLAWGLRWPWYAAMPAALAAAIGAAFIAGWLFMHLATHRGWAPVLIGGAGLLVLMILVVGTPRWAKAAHLGAKTHRPAEGRVGAV